MTHITSRHACRFPRTDAWAPTHNTLSCSHRRRDRAGTAPALVDVSAAGLRPMCAATGRMVCAHERQHGASCVCMQADSGADGDADASSDRIAHSCTDVDVRAFACATSCTLCAHGHAVG